MNKNSLIIALSIVLASFIFGSFLYITQLARQEFIEKQQEIKLNQDCLKASSDNYVLNWEMNCEKIDQVNDCPLPSHIVEFLEDRRRRDREECLKRFLED